MTTDPKNLQTTLDDLPESRAHRDPRVWALIHDARLAHQLLEENRELLARQHEMLPVIKQLVDELEAAYDCIQSERGGPNGSVHSVALHSAASFLEH